jgi:eukaryotic-like serine/threonine-protein kinase
VGTFIRPPKLFAVADQPNPDADAASGSTDESAGGNRPSQVVPSSGPEITVATSSEDTVREPGPPAGVASDGDSADGGDSADVVSHRDTIPADDLEPGPSARVRVSSGTEDFDETVDVAVDTQRPDPSDPAARAFSLSQDERLSRTLAAGDSGDLSLAEPLYDPDTEEDELADPLIGLVVADRYRIVERVGRGGMGIVYRVEHVRIGKVLAMKLLAGELSANKEIVRRFKLEALTVSKLSCPHTVQVFDYGVWNHLTYLVMELVAGHDLSRPLRKTGPLPFSRLGRLVIQVCASLQEAHEKGIVHRDIKPENIMIITDSRGVEIAKVLDFGLAKLRESPELNQVTLQGSVVGTPYYMSPEQVYGDEVDGRTDIYSLGAVMFRALTGTYPFQARSPMGMFTKHLTEEPPSPIERKPELDIPEGVSDAVQKCMAKEPDERFQTIEELRDLILDELNALPLSSSDRLLGEGSGAEHATVARAKKKRKVAVAVPADELAKSIIATRVELERYERKLRRTRYGAWTLAGALLLGCTGGAIYAYREGRVTFDGSEREPNNGANSATPLPLGRDVTAHLGRRVEAGRGDRDFFRFDVPVSSNEPRIQLAVSSLPNMAMCSVLYKVGFTQPLAQYCTGQPRQGLGIDALRLESGSYLLAVSQDLARDDDGNAPPIHENVSDPYTVRVELASPADGDEVEPNDRPVSAQLLSLGSRMTGRLAWTGDEDVFCLDRTVTAPVRWSVSDAERPRGTVLEATPMINGSAEPLARVHPGNAKPFGRPRLEADHPSPWLSPPYEGTGTRCLRLRLTSDPWADKPTAVRPNAAAYELEVLRADGAALTDPAPTDPAPSAPTAKSPKPQPDKAPKKAPTATSASSGPASPAPAPPDPSGPAQ